MKTKICCEFRAFPAEFAGIMNFPLFSCKFLICGTLFHPENGQF